MEEEIYHSPYVEKFFAKSQNIKVIDCNDNSKLCLVCFSDNGLFYPWTVSEFVKIVEIQNKYQWENLTNNKNIKEKYGKIVLCRDIYESWYLNGLNGNCRYPFDIAEKIRSVTGEEYSYVTVGSSAGGYEAVLIGCLLNAKYIISFSGQFLLGNKYERNVIVDNADMDQKKYFDLKELVIRYKGKIYYFCPAKCKRDLIQYSHIKDNRAIYTILCRSSIHGHTVLPQTMQYIIFSDEKILEHIYFKYKNKILDHRIFIIRTHGIYSGIKILLKRIYKHKICKNYTV